MKGAATDFDTATATGMAFRFKEPLNNSGWNALGENCSWQSFRIPAIHGGQCEMFEFKAPIAANSPAIRKIRNAEVEHLSLKRLVTFIRGG